MKTYIYGFHGVWLDGFMYVRAENRDEADKLFKENLPDYLKKGNINNDKLSDSIDVTEIKPGKRAIMIWDGEY